MCREAELPQDWHPVDLVLEIREGPQGKTVIVVDGQYWLKSVSPLNSELA